LDRPSCAAWPTGENAPLPEDKSLARDVLPFPEEQLGKATYENAEEIPQFQLLSENLDSSCRQQRFQKRVQLETEQNVHSETGGRVSGQGDISNQEALGYSASGIFCRAKVFG
jgi:hypothetical protein